MKKIILPLLLLLLLAGCREREPRYLDASAPAEVRARDLLSRMTLERRSGR